MEITPQVFTAQVWHRRFFPKNNQFRYRSYAIALPICAGDYGDIAKYLPINRWGLISFYNKDHGARDGGNLEYWIRGVLSQHNLNQITDKIILLAMPRVLGYVFNPVSFWLCLDNQNQLRAVLCEVHNTFGETHSYICYKNDYSIIDKNDCLRGEKHFHVSPFLERNGNYTFRFSYVAGGTQMGIWIDYYNTNGAKQLATSFIGNLKPMNKNVLQKMFWSHPLVTIKTIALIHWQAIKLFYKRIKYVNKPLQKDDTITIAMNQETHV